MDNTSEITIAMDEVIKSADFKTVSSHSKDSSAEDERLMARVGSLKRYDHLFKILVVGDTKVGKTCFIDRFTENSFDESDDYLPTIVINFKMRILRLADKAKKIKLQIWDTSAKDKHAVLVENFFSGTRGVIFCYDITERHSFHHLDKWFKQMREKLKGYDTIIKVICACKCDLEHNRQVTREEAHIFAISHGARYWETSAKSAQNVEAAFSSLTTSILAEQEGWEPRVRTRNPTGPINRASVIVRGISKRVTVPKRSATTLRRSFQFSTGRKAPKTKSTGNGSSSQSRPTSSVEDNSDTESQGRAINCLGKRLKIPSKRSKCVIS
eukprot:maker-scaffold853_size88743-snap-gene-0.14 protein:Tk09857 transcript:maker-scaffold853_size88743-snap-gene-0.14-mRNA-1 annotation:"uncharacterized protein LOC101925394"